MTPLPHVASVVTRVAVGDGAVTVDRVGLTVVDEAVVVVGEPEPEGPVRYQLLCGSPRHSPTVTARKPFE